MADTSLQIVGPASLTAAQISSWYYAGQHGQGNLNCTVDELIGWYLQAGNITGIRGDVAFAEACLETGYFTSQDTALNNFAGIGHPVGAPSGLDFPTAKVGVASHLAELYKVVQGDQAVCTGLAAMGLPGGDDGITSYYRQATTWGGLSGNWAADPDYGQKIIEIFNSMLGGDPAQFASADGSTYTTADVSGSGGQTGIGQQTLPGSTVVAGQIPGIDRTSTANPQITAATFRWPYGGTPTAAPAPDTFAAAVTTDSTVDLTYDQLPELDMTLVDPDGTLLGGFTGAINQQGGVGLQMLWGNQPLTVSEVQTQDDNGVPTVTLTLRTSFLEWMATYRVRQVWTGISATEWVQALVAQYNGLLVQGVPPATFLGDYSAQRPQILANPGEAITEWQSAYEIAQELCYEEGFWLFETNGCVVFGKPTWLATIAPGFKVGWPGLQGWRNGGPFPMDPDADVECLSYPQCLRSDQVFTGDTLQLDLPHDFGEQVRVGQQFTLSGVGLFSAEPWLVTEVQWNWDGQQTPVTISANQVKDPVPAAPGGVAPAPPQTDPTGNPPQATNLQFVDVSLSQLGRPYVWGGNSPSAGFDCSGLVQWALSQLGISFPHFSGDQWAKIAAASDQLDVGVAYLIRGALLFLDTATPGLVVPSEAGYEHVAISMGDNKHVLQAPYTGTVVQVDAVPQSYWSRAGRIPFLDYLQASG